jgi:hypothetical protein
MGTLEVLFGFRVEFLDSWPFWGPWVFRMGLPGVGYPASWPYWKSKGLHEVLLITSGLSLVHGPVNQT